MVHSLMVALLSSEHGDPRTDDLHVPRSRSKEHETGAPARKILIVDDEFATRGLLRHALRRRYRVEEAADPNVAIEALKREPADLILLDLHFPPDTGSPREGLRAFSLIRSRWPEIPVVIVTGDEDEGLRKVLLERGARAYFLKPIEMEDFTNAVRALVER